MSALAISPPLAASGIGIHLPLFRSGTRVSYQGKLCTVNYVVISRRELLVHLHETNNPVRAEKLFLEPTRVLLRRN